MYSYFVLCAWAFDWLFDFCVEFSSVFLWLFFWLRRQISFKHLLVYHIKNICVIWYCVILKYFSMSVSSFKFNNILIVEICIQWSKMCACVLFCLTFWIFYGKMTFCNICSKWLIHYVIIIRPSLSREIWSFTNPSKWYSLLLLWWF